MSYGTDLWCDERGLMTGRFAGGAQLVGQALFRRLSTTRGTLAGGPEEEVYGTNLADYVGARGTDAALAELPNLIRAECLKDDRVYSVDVSVTKQDNSDGTVNLIVGLLVTLLEASEQFTLTLSVSSVSVVVLR